MTSGQTSGDPSPSQSAGSTPRVGPALLRYTVGRLLLFLLVLVLVQLVVEERLLALGLAVLVSALLSVPLLRRPRAQLNEATAARAEQRRQQRAERRARLDES